MRRPLPSFAENRAGFAPKAEYRELPDELSSRDLWDAFNRTLQDGRERPNPDGQIGATQYSIDEDGVKVIVHKPSGREGSVWGLTVGSQDLSPIGHYFTLKNGIVVLWEQNLSVHRLRGILQ